MIKSPLAFASPYQTLGTGLNTAGQGSHPRKLTNINDMQPTRLSLILPYDYSASQDHQAR